jgi:hypothetical protein
MGVRKSQHWLGAILLGPPSGVLPPSCSSCDMRSTLQQDKAAYRVARRFVEQTLGERGDAAHGSASLLR